MIGGACLTSTKYNMAARSYHRATIQDPNTGQSKSVYTLDEEFALQVRGLTNLRGKDSGTGINFRNTLDVYHFVRIKTQKQLQIGDIVSGVTDADGEPYLVENGRPLQFIIQGVTPTFDPFDHFAEYDILADISETTVSLPGEYYLVDTGKVKVTEVATLVIS